MTTYIEKTFDSVNNFFLTSVLKRYGFEHDLIKWIKTLLKNQELCVPKGGKTAHYFKLEKGTPQRDLILAYFFILVLEKLLLWLKQVIILNA